MEPLNRVGFEPVAIPWPNEPSTAHEMRTLRNLPGSFGITELRDHMIRVASSFSMTPRVIGHGLGALLAGDLVIGGYASSGVMVAPLVPPLAGGLGRRALAAVSRLNGSDVAGLSPAQFHRYIANTTPAAESRRLWEDYAVPAHSQLLTDLASGDGTAFDSALGRGAPSGALLVVRAGRDRLSPSDSYRRAASIPGAQTLLVADAAHSLTFDHTATRVRSAVVSWMTS